MNELFTKTFWKGVKKDFDDALEGRNNVPETPVEAASPPSTPETQSPIPSKPAEG